MSHTGEVCPQSGIYSNDCHAKQIALSVGERFPRARGAVVPLTGGSFGQPGRHGSARSAPVKQ